MFEFQKFSGKYFLRIVCPQKYENTKNILWQKYLNSKNIYGKYYEGEFVPKNMRMPKIFCGKVVEKRFGNSEMLTGSPLFCFMLQ